MKNLARLQAKLRAIPAAALESVTDELAAAAAEMHGHAVKRIQSNSGSGRSYRRGGRTHVASSPGEYPNADTGGLVRSMGWYSSGLSAYFFSGVKYARMLEFGTSRIAARPFMRPTYKAIAPKYQARVRHAVRNVLRGFSVR